MRHNPLLKAMSERLLSRGKVKMQVIGALMRKLVHLAFGILKSQKPFDPNYLSATPWQFKTVSTKFNAIAGFIPIGFICVYQRLSAVSKKPNYIVGAREWSETGFSLWKNPVSLFVPLLSFRATPYSK
jgi:hypothetical protein